MKLRVSRYMSLRGPGLPMYHATLYLVASEAEIAGAHQFGLLPVARALGIDASVVLPTLMSAEGHTIQDQDIDKIEQRCRDAANALNESVKSWEKGRQWSGETMLPPDAVTEREWE